MPDATVLPYWGVLTDVDAPVSYLGLTWVVTWHILDVEERDQLTMRLERLPEPLRRTGAMKIRVAMALVAINGRRVTFRGEDSEDEFLRRIEWLDKHPEPFLDAVYDSYCQAERQPAVQYARVSADPNSAQGPAEPNGGSSDPASPTDASSVPTSGPTRPSTASSTRRSAQRSAMRTS